MATTVNATLKMKRGTEASMPTLKDGQLYLCSDTHKVYKGTSTGDNILISDIAQLNARMKNILSITRNIEGKTIKIIGDSITAGTKSSDYSCTGETIYGSYKVNVGTKCWANKLKTYLETNYNCTVNNYGISGLKSSDIVSHLADLIKSTDDIIICTIGKNNRLVNGGDITLEDDIYAIYNYVKNLGKEIIFVSCIAGTLAEETGSVGATKYFQNYDVDNIYMKVCSGLGIEYISMYKLFQDYLENNSINLSSVLDTTDQQHPTDKGYEIIYNLMLKALGFSDRKNLDIVHDTGWLTLDIDTDSFVASANNVPQIRRIGKQIYLRGSICKTVSTKQTLLYIPIELLPEKSIEIWENTNKSVPFGLAIMAYNATVGKIDIVGAYLESDISTNYINLGAVPSWIARN